MDNTAIMIERMEKAKSLAAEAQAKGNEVGTIMDIAKSVGVDEALYSNPEFITWFETYLKNMDFESKKGQQPPANAPYAYSSIQHFASKYGPTMVDNIFTIPEMEHGVSLIKGSGRFTTAEECVDYLDQNKTENSHGNINKTSMLINEDGTVIVQRVLPSERYTGPESGLGIVFYESFSVDEKGNMIMKRNGFRQSTRDTREPLNEEVKIFNPDGYEAKKGMTM